MAVHSRGSFASEGDNNYFLSKADGEDAYDTIEHLASLSWSNGCVGMIGASALGAIQWFVESTVLVLSAELIRLKASGGDTPSTSKWYHCSRRVPQHVQRCCVQGRCTSHELHKSC